MHILKWCLIVAATVVVLVVGGLLLFANVDFNAAKPRVVAWLDAATGRQWAIGGDLQVHLGRDTRISARDLRILNPDWAGAENFLRVDELDLVIDLWSLVRGPVLIQRLDLRDAELAFESDAQARTTWSFGSPGKPASEAEDDPIALLVRDASLADLRLVYSSPDIDRALEVRIASARQHQKDDGSLTLEASGSFDDKPLRIDGGCRDFDAFLSGRNLDCALDGQLGDLAISGQVFLDSLSAPREPRVDLQIRSPDAARLSDLLGLPELARGDLNIAANVATVESGVTARLKGNLANVEVDARAELPDSSSFENFVLDVDARGPHLGELLKGAGVIKGLPDEDFRLSAHFRRAGELLEVKDTALVTETAELRAGGSVPAFPLLRDAQMRVHAHGSDIAAFRELTRAGNALRGPFSLDAAIDGVSQKGGARIDVVLDAEPVELRIAGPIGDAPDFVGSELAITARGADLNRLGAAWGIASLPAGSFDLDGELKITGRGFLSTADLDLQLAGARFHVAGTAGIDPKSPATDLRVEGSGADVSMLLAAAGIAADAAAGPFRLSGRLRAAGGRYRLDGVQLGLGPNAFGFEGFVAPPPLLTGTALRVTANGPSARELGRLAGLGEGIAERPYDISGRLEIGTDGYALEEVELEIGNGRIGLEGLIGRPPEYLGSRVKMSGTGPRLEELLADNRYFDVRPGPYRFSLIANYAKRELAVESLHLEAAGAQIDASLTAELGEETRGSFELDARGPDVSAYIPETTAWQPGALPFDIAAHGSWRGKTLELQDSRIGIADAELKLGGSLDRTERANLLIGFQVADLSRLGRLGADPLPSAPLRLSANVHGQLDDFRLEDIEARFADTDFSGRAAIDLTGKIPAAEIEIAASALDLRSSVEELPGRADPAAAGASGSKRVIADAELPLQALRVLDARARLRVDEMRVNGLQLTALAVGARLEGGDLVIDRAEASGPGGRLAMRLELHQRDQTADISAVLEGANVVVDPTRKGMPERSAADVAAAPRYGGKLSLRATGATVYDLLGTLDGAGGITSDGGRLANRRFAAIYSPFVEQMFSAVDPFRERDPNTQISCMGAYFSIKDGIVRADPGLVVQTDKINVMSKGEVDLRKESLRLDFRTEARGALPFGAGELVNPFIGIGGTFSEPKITLNPASTLLSGGAAIATGGMSLLATAAWNRTFRATNPCASLASDAAKTNPRIKELLDRVELLDAEDNAGPAIRDR